MLYYCNSVLDYCIGRRYTADETRCRTLIMIAMSKNGNYWRLQIRAKTSAEALTITHLVFAYAEFNWWSLLPRF